MKKQGTLKKLATKIAMFKIEKITQRMICDHIGYDYSTISRVISCQQKPSDELINKLVEASEHFAKKINRSDLVFTKADFIEYQV